jgi:hypothetical protein
VCKLRRTVSERFKHETKKVVFHDTMALRSRTPRSELKITFGEKDLQRLDGLTSKTRRKSPTKLRPNEPPPPPPPSVTPDNSDVEIIQRSQSPDKLVFRGKNADVKMKVIETNEKLEITDTNPQVIEKPIGKKIVPTFETKDNISKDLLDGKRQSIKENFFEKEDNANDEEPKKTQKKSELLPKEKNIKDEVKVRNKEQGIIDIPPSAPPRKRSSNKQPHVHIVQTSPTVQAMHVELPTSPSNDHINKTIVQINGSQTVHKLQIKNEFTDVVNVQTVSVLDGPQRKTSIMITGDDCYSTVNVNDDVPLYQSSVVVKDTAAETTVIQNSKKSSSVYITGNFVTSEPVTPPVEVKECLKEFRIDESDNENNLKMKNSSGNVNKEYEECELVENKKVLKNENNILLDTFDENNIPSSELLKELLKDPVEAVRRNLVPHVCGKSDVPRRQRTKKFVSNEQNALDEAHLETAENMNVTSFLEDSFLRLKNLDSLGDDVSSEHSSSTQYELMDASSECYTDHSNRSSVTEEELANRTKFYELLADSSIVEVSENEDHHYESIKINSDPIYEEIEIPPPLPTNPPPLSLLDDLHLDKEYTTR